MSIRLNLILMLALMLIVPSLMVYAGAETPEEYSPLDRSDWDVLYTEEFQLLVPPSGDARFSFDPSDGTIEIKDNMPFSDDCLDAIEASPEWIRNDLAYKLSRIPSVNDRDALASVINNAEDERYIDEIAFSIAHLPVESLTHRYFFPQILEENARDIYEHDQYLQYVEIIELPDNMTTLRYKNQDNASTDLDPEIYYWYVVHPKLSDELPTYVNPNYNYATTSPNDRNYGVTPPTGRFWREYLFTNNKSGQPLLKDALVDAYTVWDGIRAINGWVSASMRFTSDNERPVQPVRIYQKGIGRCGEHQDLRGAAARSALIPVAWTSNMAEDHAWNEFWEGRWVHWDGMIDKPLTYENGWGKTISTVWNFRSDGFIWPVTSTYSEGSSTLDITVKDRSGYPVDGAEVILATENFYDNTQLALTTWGISDGNGKVVFDLGDSRNFWAGYDGGSLGEHPSGGTVTQVISDSVAGRTYTESVNLPNSFGNLKASGQIDYEPEDPIYKLDMDFDVVSGYIPGVNLLTGETYEIISGNDRTSFFYLNQNQLGDYQGGDQYRTLNLTRDADIGTVTHEVGNDGIWTGVFRSERTLNTWRIVNVTVDVYSVVHGEIDEPTDNEMYPICYPLEISGTAWSPWGIERVDVKIEGQEWQEVSGYSSGGLYGTEWEATIQTNDCDTGDNEMIVRLFDGEHYVYLQKTFELVDQKAPVIENVRVTNEPPLVVGDNITIMGEVSDNHRIKSLEISMRDIAPSSMDITNNIVNGTFTFSFDSSELPPSMDINILFILKDASRNSVHHTIVLNLLYDHQPSVHLTEEKRIGVFKTGSIIPVELYVNGINDLESVIVYIDDEEYDDITDADPDSDFDFEIDTSELDLEEGDHEVRVELIDVAGKSANDTSSFFLDAGPPVLELLEPKQDHLYDGIGGVSFRLKIDEIKWVYEMDVYLNDELIYDRNSHPQFGNGFNIENFELGEFGHGINTIEIIATDAAGWTSTLISTFDVDLRSPLVSISSEPLYLQGEEMILLGDIEDDHGISRVDLVIDEGRVINISGSVSNNILFHEIDTSTFQEGMHKVVVKAFDSLGRSTERRLEFEIITNTTDTDSDGMPDWWELKFEQLNRSLDDSEMDLDLDGTSNLDEYLGQDGEAGNDDWTDPTDVTSYPLTKETSSGPGAILFVLIAVLVLIIFGFAALLLFLNGRKKTAPVPPSQGPPPQQFQRGPAPQQQMQPGPAKAQLPAGNAPPPPPVNPGN